MPEIHSNYMTAEVEGDIVVFLIGFRMNRWWKVSRWLPVLRAMPRMLQELYANPESGFLGHINGFGFLVQYWRSYEHLEAYARDKNGAHWPAWLAFNKSIANANGDVGIWHETYVVRAGQWETIYKNMPSFGLAKATRVTPIRKEHRSSRERLSRTQ